MTDACALPAVAVPMVGAPGTPQAAVANVVSEPLVVPALLLAVARK